MLYDIMNSIPLFLMSYSLSLRISVYSSGIYSLKSGRGWIGFFTGMYMKLNLTIYFYLSRL